MTASKIWLMLLINMIPRHAGARGGVIRTHWRVGGGKEQVALLGAQNELKFLAVGLTYRRLHASGCSKCGIGG